MQTEILNNIQNNIKFISYKDFELWDVKRYVAERMKSDFPVVKLGLYIQEESHKVKLYDFPEEEFGILGVNNKIGIFEAYKEKGANINQAYKRMEKGWLAYNPYRVNVGSIGMRTEEHKHEYISPAYVVFRCKETLLPDFLFKLFKTEKFNKIIRENTTGSVRQNLTFDIMKTLDIALPPIEVQRELLNKYYKKQNNSLKQLDEILEIEKKINEYFLNKLVIKQSKSVTINKGLNFINFKDIQEWEVSRFSNLSLQYTSRFPLITMNELCNNFKNGLNYSANQAGHGTSIVNISDLYNDDGFVCKNELEKVEFNPKQIKSNSLNNNDLLFVRSSVKYEGVGYPSLINIDKNEQIVFAGFVIKCSPLKEKVNPLYLLYLLRSEFFRNIIIHLSSKTIITNISQDKLKSIKIPLPEFSIQNSIVKEIKEFYDAKILLKQQAEQNQKEAIKEFEQAIFKN